MTIRGPSRVNKEQAHIDAGKLEKAADGGDAKSVKDVANEMVRNGNHVP